MNIKTTFNSVWIKYMWRIRLTRRHIRILRVCCILLAILLSVFIAYRYMRPRVSQDVVLPGGLANDTPALNTTTLQKLLENKVTQVTSFELFSNAFLK